MLLIQGLILLNIWLIINNISSIFWLSSLIDFLGIVDMAMSNEATLLSRNLRDFGRVEGLRVEDWAIAEEKG
jgi:hypothetical protein